jgi:hypothetical protein
MPKNKRWGGIQRRATRIFRDRRRKIDRERARREILGLSDLDIDKEYPQWEVNPERSIWDDAEDEA